jgi:hypothetical protein
MGNLRHQGLKIRAIGLHVPGEGVSQQLLPLPAKGMYGTPAKPPHVSELGR